MNKKGWTRILEATVAILIVSATMLAVYSNQPRGSEEITVSDYSYSLQREILADISDNSSLRLDVLGVVDDLPGDESYDSLNDFVGGNIPDSFGYLLRVCELGEVCKMDAKTFVATLDRDVFVEEVLISSELGDGGDPVYSPRNVRLFFWEGGLPEEFCVDECLVDGTVLSCSADLKEVLSRTCADHDDDGCLEYDVGLPEEFCGDGELCVGAACVGSLYSEWTCGKKVNDSNIWCAVGQEAADECIDTLGFDGWVFIGDSHHPLNTINCDSNIIRCWNWEDKETLPCSSNPVCPSGSDFVSAEVCETEEEEDEASLSLEFSNVHYVWQNPYHYYYHDRTFVESDGVGVTLTSFQVCSQSSGCNPVGPVNYRIDANTQIALTNKYFYTSYSSDIFTLTYWGEDDNANSISVSQVMTV